MSKIAKEQERCGVIQQRFVVITGAAGGIGRAMVQEFVANGYTVIATDRVPESEGLGAHHYLQADLARSVEDEAYAEGVFNQIRTWLGNAGLAALINNAAVQILGGADSLTRSDWQKTLNVNLLGPFIWTQALLPALEQSNGSVINISSIHAKLTKKNFVAYATSKAALSGMTRAMAVDLGGRVRVNCIEPAAIATDMLQRGFEKSPSGLMLLAKYHPSGAIGTPLELANSVRKILEMDTVFLNGATLSFDGAISSCLHDPDAN